MAFLVPTLGACTLAGAVAVRHWASWLTGAPAALAHMVAITAAVIAAHLVAGAAGAFVPEAALLSALLLAAAVLAPAARRGGAGHPASTRGFAVAGDGGRLAWLLAGGAALAVAGCALALVRDVAGAPVNSIDALNFQVPIPARWLQTDSVWGLHQFVAEYSNATYPQHGNVLVAAVMLPFDSAFLTRLVAVPYWVLTAVGIYALARELGTTRPAAILGASAFAALPVFLRAGLEGVQTDAPMLACLVTGALFLVRHHRTGARGELVLAGVALGLALGTKWYALTSLAVIGAVWVAARVAAHRRFAWRQALALTGLILAAGGFWLARNWVETGNPLFPQPLEPLFSSPPDPLREIGGFTLAHYLFDWSVWDEYLRPAFTGTFGWTGAVLVLGALLAVVLARRRPRAPSRPPVPALEAPASVAPQPVGPVFAIAAATVLLAAAYAVTPYSAFGPEGAPVLAAASTRYGLPALLGAAVLSAWAASHAGRGRLAAEIALALAVLDGLRRGFDLPAGKIAGAIVAVAALAAGTRWLIPRLRGRAAWAAAAGALVLAGLAGAEGLRDRANDQGYGQFDPTLAWIERNAPAGKRIALAGHWSPAGISPVLPAFGPRLRNDVVALGRFRRHLLRAHTTAGPFKAQLQQFDLLVVGRGDPPQRETRELRWAFEAGWSLVADSPRLALLAPPVRSA